MTTPMKIIEIIESLKGTITKPQLLHPDLGDRTLDDYDP